MTWWAVGVTAVSTVASAYGSSQSAGQSREAAKREKMRARLEAGQRERDLFAEYEASIEQQRDALAKRELSDKAEAEMLRQANLARETVDVDLSGGILTGQQRAARRRSYFEDV